MSQLTGNIPQNAIAIIGMAGRFPGARTPAELWRLVREGREAIRPLSDAELRAAGVPTTHLAAPNYVRATADLDDMESFDAAFFGFSPRDAAIMDPQHRHFLECAWEALEAAGHVPESFDGPIGVFGGCGMQAYFARHLLPNASLMASIGAFLVRHTGNDKDFLTTRVSYQLNLRGPSVSVQTACSTSLVAVHLACQSLLGGECDMALAGGATIELPHRRGYFYEEGEILSPDGHCRAFDAESKGTVFGSGVGVVVLRRLTDALAAGDHIHAVILGSAVNNDGSGKVSYLAPSVDGQTAVVAEALALAGVTADTVTYVETHGTGTPVGDPIEITGLTEAFRRDTTRSGFCAIGSLKTNIGHLDTAAGVASLIKAASAVEHGELPPSLHFRTPNPAIPFDETPFFVNAALQPWTPEGPRRAGVTSLGVGGTNAHVVIEEAPARPAVEAGKTPNVIVLSAKTAGALDNAASRLASHLEAHPSTDSADVAWTLQVGRRAFEHRRAIVYDSLSEAVSLLRDSSSRRVFDGRRSAGTPSIVFLFPGGGAQYPGMGREIYEREPVFRHEVDRGLEILRRSHHVDLRPLLFPNTEDVDAAGRELERSTNSILSIFIVEYALGRLWMSWGIQPAAMTGHSLGEYAAACLAGVFSFEDALTLVKARGDIFERLPAGAMLSVPMSEADLRPWLTEDLGLAAANAPTVSVVSGPVEQIDRLEAALEARGIEGRRLHIAVAAHSAMLDPHLAAFRERVSRIALSAPTMPFISNVTGRWAEASAVTRHDYWVRHLRQTVRFSAGLSTILEQPDRVLVEVGPGVALGSLARQHLPADAPAVPVLASMRHPQDVTSDLTVLYGALAQVWISGQPVDWRAFQGNDRRRVPLPTYPFEHVRHWIEAPVASAAPQSEPATADSRRVANWLQVPVWHRAGSLRDASAIGTRWLVLASGATDFDPVVSHARQCGAQVVIAVPGDAYVAPAPGTSPAMVDPENPADFQRLIADLSAMDCSPTHVVVGWRVASMEPPTRGFFALMALAQALAEAGTADVQRLVVVTHQMYSVHGERTRDPEQALAAGAAAVLASEMPPLSTTTIDIAADDDASAGIDARTASRIVAEIIAGRDSRVSLRRGERWTPGFAQLPESSTAPAIRANGTYLLTGGLGGIALAIADVLSRRETVHLVLVSRQSLPPRATWNSVLAAVAPGDLQAERIRRILAIEARGSTVELAAGDISVASDVDRIVDDVRTRFGAIHGVVHAAGVIADNLVALKSTSEAERVLAPKVAGTLNLARALENTTLDFWVNCSSVSAMIGLPGQLDYAAANAFLDAFAHARSSRPGLGPTVSINWQAWRDVGMLRDTTAATTSIDDSYVPAAGPLLRHHRQSSEDHRFISTFAAASDWVLDEHRLADGTALLPGTSYLAMAVESARAIGGRAGVVELSDVAFLAPFAVPDDARQLSVSVAPSGEFVMSSRDGSGDVEHVRGSVCLVAPTTPASADLVAIAARCPRRIDDALPNLRHLRTGPRWAAHVTAHAGKREAVARIEFPAAYAAELQQYDLHPALLDVATAMGPLLVEGYEADRDFYVPLSYERVIVYAPLREATLMCHTRLGQADMASRDLVVIDVTICTTDGRPLVEVRGFSARRLPAGAARSLVSGRPSTRRTTIDLSDAIRPDEGAEAFVWVLQSLPLAQVMVGPKTYEEVATAATVTHVSSAPRRTSRATTPPADAIERTIAEIWSELLGVEQLGVDEDFFELGGHSLLLTQVGGRIRKTLKVHVPLTTLFERPTVRHTAAYCRAAASASDEPPLTAIPRHTLRRRRPASVAGVEDVFVGPASPAQQSLWFLNQLSPESPAYNIASVYILDGALDTSVLQRSIDVLIERHESLRTTLEHEGGQVVQVIHPARPHAIQFLAADDSPSPQQEALRLAANVVSAPFDLAHGPLFRVGVVTAGRHHHVLAVVTHHTISDGISQIVLLEELTTVYADLQRGSVPALPPVSIQYVDYCVWQQKRVTPDFLERQIQFWRERLAHLPEPLPLPGDRPRPSAPSGRGAHVQFVIGAHTTAALREVCRTEGVTMFMVLTALLDAWLARHTDSTDILVGTPVSGRSRPEIEAAAGLFANTAVVRSDLSGNPSFREILRRVKGDALATFEHADVPFNHLVETLNPARRGTENPFFQVMCAVLRVPDTPVSLPGTLAVPADVTTATSRFDLLVEFQERTSSINVDIEYSTDLFDADTMQRWAARLACLADGAVASPDRRLAELPFIPDEERRLLDAFNATEVARSDADTVVPLVAAAIARQPNRTAVEMGDARLSYAELATFSDHVAAYLVAAGVTRGDLVGVHLERSVEMVAVLLGILRAGAAYVPLDPAFPRNRLQFMAEDAGLRLIVTDDERTQLTDKVPHLCLATAGPSIQACPPLTLPLPAPDDLAYVLYTSGSTGRPKGVEVSHRAFGNFLLSMQHEPGLTPEDRLLAVTTLSFDIAGLELFLPLVAGATVVVATRHEAMDPEAIDELLARRAITVMQATPVTWRMLLEHGWKGKADLKVITGGEPLTRDLGDRLLRSSAEVWNGYGPTETTVYSTLERVSASPDVVTIGHPIANTHIHVVDRHMTPVPIGVVGEIAIGGMGVARGYLRRPELAAERFVAGSDTSHSSGLLYRTGDLGRLRADGRLECLGRIDHQVKVRGFRIELGEIESVLVSHPTVRHAAVVVRNSAKGESRLVAYVVRRTDVPSHATDEPRENTETLVTALRLHLGNHLPTYMIPSAFIEIDALPLTPNGKIDRAALPEPAPQVPAAPVLSNMDDMERTIAAIWSEVLDIEQTGLDQNFFDLGGHSLLLNQVAVRIRETLKVHVSLATLFERPTIRQTAAYCRAEATSVASEPQLTAVPRHTLRRLPASTGTGGSPKAPSAT